MRRFRRTSTENWGWPPLISKKKFFLLISHKKNSGINFYTDAERGVSVLRHQCSSSMFRIFQQGPSMTMAIHGSIPSQWRFNDGLSLRWEHFRKFRSSWEVTCSCVHCLKNNFMRTLMRFLQHAHQHWR